MNEINTKIEAGVLTVQIARPEKRNALNKAVAAAIISALEPVKSDPSIRVVLLQGEGDKAFCAGADVTELANPEDREGVFTAIGGLYQALLDVPVPVVAAAQGYVFAGGVGLLACSDMVIGSDTVRIGLPEHALGILPAMVIGCLRSSIHRKVLFDMVLTGRRLSAQEGQQFGFLSRVVASEDFSKTIEEVLTPIRQSSREFAESIRAVSRISLPELQPEDFMKITDVVSKLSRGADASKRIAGFLSCKH